MPEEHAAAYRGVRERVTGLLRAAGPGAADAVSPATPEWRVRDVLAHLVGVADDALAGRLDGVATEPWTRAQVDARRGATVDDMLAEWDELGPRFEAALAALPAAIGGQAVFDAVTHEADIRHALARPGARESDAVRVAYDWVVHARAVNGAPALELVTEAGTTLAGAGEPQGRVKTSRFEVLRAMSGRRSAEEIAAYEWEREPRPEVMLVADIFTVRDTPLHE